MNSYYMLGTEYFAYECSKDSLYLEHFCHKSSQTFGKKFLIVPHT